MEHAAQPVEQIFLIESVDQLAAFVGMAEANIAEARTQRDESHYQLVKKTTESAITAAYQQYPEFAEEITQSLVHLITHAESGDDLVRSVLDFTNLYNDTKIPASNYAATRDTLQHVDAKLEVLNQTYPEHYRTMMNNRKLLVARQAGRLVSTRQAHGTTSD